MSVLHVRKYARGPESRIVNKTVDRTEFASQRFNKAGQLADVRQVEGSEVQRSMPPLGCLGHRRGELLGRSASDRNDLKSRCGKLLRDPETKTPASARYNDITHD